MNDATLIEANIDTPVGVVAFIHACILGLLAGAIAQYLRQSGNALSTLGGATAPWITAGFLLSLRVARRRSTYEGAVWASAVLATYLLAWLLSYHTVFAIRESVDASLAWLDARSFVAAVTPVCIVLGLIAAFSYHKGLLGYVCVALPLGWSLPEAYLAVQRGWSYAIVVALPTLALSAIPLIAIRVQKRNGLIIALSATICGLALYSSYSLLSGVFNR
jgi:hypothetical protein